MPNLALAFATIVSLLGSATARAADDVIRLVYGGRERRAVAFVPEALRGSPAPAPVVIGYHGGGGSADQFREQAGLDAIARREGFVALYPEGVARPGLLSQRLHTWNAGGCCGFAQKEGVDDVGFTLALLDEFGRRRAIDRKRVFALGHSNGAMMSYRLAAEAAEHVVAIAPVGGAMNLASFDPARAVAVLHIHSVDDPRALYAGGLGPPFPFTDHRSHHEPVESGLAAWRKQNGCRGDGEVRDRRSAPGDRADAGYTAERIEFGPCASDRPVVLWRLRGPGHGWPGEVSLAQKPRRWWSRQIGPASAVVDAAEEAWRFFAATTPD